MKKMLFILLALSIFFGCSKDESNDFSESHLIEYKANQNYTQIFYYGGGCPMEGMTGIGIVLFVAD